MSDAYDGCPEFDAALLETGVHPVADARLDAHLAVCSRCRDARSVYLKTTEALFDAFTASDPARELFATEAAPHSPAAASAPAGVRAFFASRWKAAGIGSLVMVALAVAAVRFLPDVAPARAVDVSAPPARRVVHPVGESRTYRTETGPLAVVTPIGVAEAVDAVFKINASATAEARRPDMSAAKIGTIAVAVSVISGIVWWKAVDDAPRELKAGDAVVRTASPVGAPPAEAPRNAADAGADAGGGRITSRPFVDLDPEAAAAAAEAHAGKRFAACFDDDGSRLVAAAFVVHRGDVVLGSGETDEQGRLFVAPFEGEAAVVVVPQNRGPFSAALTLAAAEPELRAPPASAVSGTVEFANAAGASSAPTEAIGILLITDVASAVLTALPPLPRAALAAVEKAAEKRPLRVVTGAGGVFRFGGLSPDWTGEIRPEPPYELVESADDTRSLRLDRPTVGLVLKLRDEPAVVGRIVRPGTREPVANGRVQIRIVTRDMAQTSTSLAGPDGRFRIAITVKQLVDLTLTLGDPEGRGGREIVLREKFDQRNDVGDIEIEPLRELSLLVTDRAGAPIVGAVATTEDEAPASAATDAGGRTKLFLRATAKAVRVAALGYAVASVALPANGIDELKAVLDAGTLVRASVTGPGGAIPGGVRVRLTGARQNLFASGGGFGDDAYKSSMTGGMSSGGSTDKSCEIAYTTDAAGKLTIPGLVHGFPLELAAVDVAGAVLDSAVFELRPGEHRDVALVVSRVARRIGGKVVDPAGRPLAGVEATIKTGSSTYESAVTDVAGRFGFANVYAESFGLELAKAGYVRRVVAAWTPTPPESPETFTLEPGLKLTVRVVDRDDAPLRDVDVQAQILGADGKPDFTFGRLRATSAATGVALLVDLPPATVRVFAWIGDRIVELRHDPRQGDAVLKADVAYGTVEIECAEQPKNRNCSVGVRARGSVGPLQVYGWSNFDANGRGVVVLKHVPAGEYDAVVIDGSAKEGPALWPVQEIVVRPRETVRTKLGP